VNYRPAHLFIASISLLERIVLVKSMIQQINYEITIKQVP
jgi:hypothetical protein